MKWLQLCPFGINFDTLEVDQYYWIKWFLGNDDLNKLIIFSMNLLPDAWHVKKTQMIMLHTVSKRDENHNGLKKFRLIYLDGLMWVFKP